MISQSTLEAVYPLAEKLTERGIKLSPMPTTPVDQLVQAGHLPMPTRGVDLNEFAIEERILRGSMAKDAMGAVRHDMVMDEVVEVVANTVRNNLNLARTVVNPIVKQVAEETEEYIQNAEAVKKTHVSVVPVFYQDIWNSPILSEMVERYNETAVRDVPLRLGVPHDLESASLLALAKTGASRFDEEVEKLFAAMSETNVRLAYTSVFSPNAPERARTLTDPVNVNTDPNRAILVHLFARSLMQEAPEGVDTSIADYRSYMADIVSQSGRVINSIMKRREGNRTRRQLIPAWPLGRARLGQELIEIKVNGDVYNQWLSEGGTPETIIGAFISDQERGYTALLGEVARYEKEWTRQERILTTTQRLTRFNHAVEGMRLAIAGQINELDDEQLPVDRGTLHQRLNEQLGTLSGKFYENLYESARKMVCCVMFPHTLAYPLLAAIDNVASDYPDIEVREAALLATIEIVSEWVAKLCKIDYVRG